MDGGKRTAPLRLLFLLLCLLSYGASWTALAARPDLLPAAKAAQAGTVYAAGGLFCAAAFLLGSYPSFIAVVLLLPCAAFIANAAGPETAVLGPAAAATVLAAALVLPTWAALAGAAALAGILAGALQPHTAWGRELPGAGASDGFVLLALGLPVLCAGLLLRRLADGAARIAEDRNRLDEAYRRLADANLDFQTYALFAREEAMDLERRRLAGELHDIIGYTLTNLIMLIQAAQYGKGGPEETGAILEKARLHADGSLREARRALAALRGRKSGRPQGAQLFLRLARTFQEVTGVAVSTDFAYFPSELPRETEKLVYRVIQEGLTNAFRHGKATAIFVDLGREGENLHLRIRDNGTLQSAAQGETPERSGIGLAGLREQAEALGGRLHAAPVADGFVLSATVPIKDADYES